MKCVLNNSSALYFGQQNATGGTMKNEPLNFGVVTPPNQLPNTSIYNTVYSNQSIEPQKQMQLGLGEKVSAGKVSAGCAFSAIGLALLSLLPIIRKH